MDLQSYLLGFPTWGHDVVKSMEKEKFINVGLSKYMEF
jgi:hypothetical protein